jgi:outer membrane protein TolC
MRLRVLLSAPAALAALAHAATAQEPSRGDTFDLARAVATARAGHPAIAARLAARRAAHAEVRSAGAWPDPVLTISAMNQPLAGAGAPGEPMAMRQVGLMQMLPVNGVPGRLRAAARSGADRADRLHAAATLAVERDVRFAYWALYHAERALEVMIRRRAVLADLAATIAARYRVGLVVQADVLRADVAVTRLDQDLDAMRLERARAAATLNEAMGRLAEEPIALPARGSHAARGAALSALPTPAPPPLGSLVTLAERENPEIRAAVAALAAARAREAASRRARIPDIGVGAAYGQRGGFADMLSVMVSMSLPVFAREERNQVAAGAAADALEREVEVVRRRVRAQLTTAHAEAETSRRLVGSFARTLIPQARASYEASLSAYGVGRTDLPALLETLAELFDYEHDLHRYEAMYGAAVAEIDRLTGRAYGEAAP